MRPFEMTDPASGNEMLGNILRGIAAGFVATSVLSLMMLSKGLIPQLDPVIVLDTIAREVFTNIHLPVPLAGWMWHFLIGSVWWGGCFGIMEPILPGRRGWIRGLYYGLVLGLIVAWAISPLVGAGAFGMQLTPMKPVVTLIQHIVYGVVLALVFNRLSTLFAHHPRGDLSGP
jgi:hypothetical protein